MLSQKCGGVNTLISRQRINVLQSTAYERYNSNNPAPMKFQLGVIANARLNEVSEETRIKEYIKEKHIRWPQC